MGQNGVELQDILLGVSELLDIVRPLPNAEMLQIVPNHFRDTVSTVILEEMHSYDLNFSFFLLNLDNSHLFLFKMFMLRAC